jgi:hypothetical protein
MVTWANLRVFERGLDVKKVLMSLLLGSFVLVPHLAHATTYFYVDRNFSGTRNGSASNPWQSLSDSGAWTAINNALAADDVVVYFSAREAGADTNEATTTNLVVNRTNTTSNRLTLTGMDKYNTNDSFPSWADYNGACKFQITVSSGDGAIQAGGVGSEERHYVTIRGFRVIGTGSGPSHLVETGGSHVIYEHLIVSGESTSSAIHFEYAITIEPCTDITFRNNVFYDVYKEALYIGGCQNEDQYGHTNINIIDNHIYRSSGDGIDIKDGNRSIAVRGNVVHDCGGTGIVSHSAMLCEKNLVYNNGSQGISHGDYWGRKADTHSGDVWRNNVVYGNRQNNLRLNHSSGQPGISNVRIYNNTLYDAGVSNIRLDDGSFNNVWVQNNIAYLSGSTNISISAGGTVVNDHNYAQNPSFVNAATGDFSLQPGSPCIDAGVALTGFADDFRGASRPSGSAWDIGAYEYGTAGLPGPPAAPTGLTVIPE